MKNPRAKAKVIIPEDGLVTVHLVINHNQYFVMKASLKKYDNGYGLEVLRAMERAEQFRDQFPSLYDP